MSSSGIRPGNAGSQTAPRDGIRRLNAQPAAHQPTAANDWKPPVATRPWKHIVLHHTATDRGSVESIHQSHLQRRDGAGRAWLGIGYHFVIGNGDGMPDGKIEPTFRWTKQIHGAHAGISEYNQLGIGIVLIGNFEEHRPTAAQLRSARQLVHTLQRVHKIESRYVIGHGKLKNTACPGRYFAVADLTVNPVETRLGQTVSTADSATIAGLEKDRRP